ncbi:hypothetical protein [Mycobacteroides abscessus]|uniref:hypothetical protein n=1 Tax=Mycobacteroides abscessus TaxID=36809 RepID=UPI000D924C8F|nr:hypothetical protein [Mycobacteroides abscessus]SPX82479.1 Uncharacterised protein [Mycobacteroides abscessus]
MVFDLDLRGSREHVDLSGLPFPRLTRALGVALHELIASPGTMRDRSAIRYVVKRIREFVAVAAAACSGTDPQLSDMEPGILEVFELNLIKRYGKESKEAYLSVTYLVRLLKLVHDADPEAFNPRFHARLAFTSMAANRATKPLDAYPFPVLDALELAAREDISRIRERIIEGEKLATLGRDPRLHGWDRLENGLWYVVNHGPVTADDISDKALDKVGGRMELNSRLHLNARDLVAFTVLLACQTGMEPECIRQLRSTCLTSPARGYVSVAYVKKRARGSAGKTMRVADGGSLRFPGAVISLALRLTQRTRDLIGSDALWCDVSKSGKARAPFDSPFAWSTVTHQWIADHRLGALVDPNGSGASLDLRRIRKTVKSRQYLQSNGVLEDFAKGHTRGVAATHYANIDAHREIHEEAVENGLMQALNVATAPPMVLTEQGERLDEGAGDLNDQEIQAALSGESDVWMASCRDFYHSPFARKDGAACPVPVWGCLECPNAVFTSRHLPNILSFLDFLEQQRQEYSVQEWAARFGSAWERIVHGIKTRFSEAQIATAHSIAEAGGDRLSLPASFLEAIR